MKVSFDRDANAAYIRLRDKVIPGSVKRTLSVDSEGIDAWINLDFDAEGRLVGIEVINATRWLPPELLANAE